MSICFGQTRTFFLCGLTLLIPTSKISGCFDAQGADSPSLRKSSTRFAASAQMSAERARQADSFVDSVGVVTHLSYDNTPYYQRWPTVFALLRGSGIRHIRDGYYDWEPSSAFIKEHQALGQAGIRTTYVVPVDAKTTPQAIVRFANLVQDLEAIEAPNECDSGQNCGGGGAKGIANAAAFQKVVHRAGELLHVPVLGPSFTSREAYEQVGDLSMFMTFNNLHIYFGGRHPGSGGWGEGDAQGHHYGSIDWWMDQGRADGKLLPVAVTETGYMMPERPKPYEIPRSLGGEYLPRTLLLAFNHHVIRTFMYELLDEISSPDYGLLTADLHEKPAFTAVRSLLQLLSDPGPPFSPDMLPYSIEGDGATLAHTLLQKRDGSFWLILWKEDSDYDPAVNMAKVNPIRDITLTLKQGFAVRQISTFDSAGVMTSRKPSGLHAPYTLSIDGHPTVVMIASTFDKP